MKVYSLKHKKLLEVEKNYKQVLAENYEKKKRLIKRHSDLMQLEKGIYIEEESPMAKFLREMTEERERIAEMELLRKEEEARMQKKKDEELQRKLKLEEDARRVK